MNKLTLGLLIGIMMVLGASAQTLKTKITRIEVDEKEYKKDYKVSFLVGDTWIKAERTPTGFTVPLELQSEKHLRMLITFGKHRLEFADVDIAGFAEDWIVGVDTKPYSSLTLTEEEAKKTKQLYYIRFLGGHGTVLTVRVSED
jgi:hypothetical protein